MIEWLDAGTIELFQPLHNPVLTVIMKFFTTIGEGGAVWILAAVLLLLFKKTRKAGIILAGALILCLLSCNIALKNLVARPRPCWRREDLEMLILPGGLGGFALTDLAVLRKESGAPYFALTGPAAEWTATNALTPHLSLTHENGLACAFVILEQKK